MSTRYVWDRYTTVTGIVPTTTLRDFYQSDIYSSNDYDVIIYGTDCTLDGSYVIFNEFGRRWVRANTTITIPAGNFFAYSPSYSGDSSVTVELNETMSSCGVLYAEEEYSVRFGSALFGSISVSSTSGVARSCASGLVKNEFNATVSSSSNSTYPSSGVSGTYYYEYKGSDDICPSAVTIPSVVNGGENITATVTPSSGNVYGGTVQYQYSYRTSDTGDWTTLTTTNATSCIVPVPFGAEIIQVRVKTQDNIGFVSTDYVLSNVVTVINNNPPSAPTSIEAVSVAENETATITWGAATDSDGTIVSYTLEHKVDGGSYTQIFSGNALTTTDQIGEWATVTYRVCAVDNDGATSDWTTSSDYTVQTGKLVINGPNYTLGEQPNPFTFSFTISISGVEETVTDVATTVSLDGTEHYSDTPDVGDTISFTVDTRFLSSGSHALVVNVSKGDYVPATETYTFTIPAIDVPAGGVIQRFENSIGDSVYPITLARCVVTAEGQDVLTLIADTQLLMNIMLGVE